ncbi:hypothetical protein CIB48_g7748 [Xylaria polymorpha]|nr:hypothetical protein CIB48_g7748 [Xylaria polymorpha]
MMNITSMKLVEVPSPVAGIVSSPLSIPYRKQVRAGPGSGVALHHASNGSEVTSPGKLARASPKRSRKRSGRLLRYSKTLLVIGRLCLNYDRTQVMSDGPSGGIHDVPYGNGKVSIDKGGASRDIATSPLPEAERRGMTAHFRRKEMARQIVPLRAVPLTGLAWIME